MCNKLLEEISMRTVLCSVLFLGIIAPTAALAQAAQTAKPAHEVDLAVTYSPQYRDGTNGNSFWSQGGSVELTADFYRGFGISAAFSVNHASNINGSGVNLTTYTPAFGPRYTWRHRRLAIFGEGLIGVSEGTGSIFPSPGGALPAYRTLAVQAGGGVDWRLSQRIAVRPLQASWVRTQFPNATTNVQNTLQLGAGVVFRLQR
jgi:hypothetical protein